jgi:hypothetical protein
VFDGTMPTTVRVPDAFAPLFDEAERYVSDAFSRFVRDPARGTIHVADERYVLVRAASLTTGFLEVMRDLIGEEGAFARHGEQALRSTQAVH